MSLLAFSTDGEYESLYDALECPISGVHPLGLLKTHPRVTRLHSIRIESVCYR